MAASADRGAGSSLVDVIASGIISSEAVNPTVMYGRFAISTKMTATRIRRSTTRYIEKWTLA